MSKIFRNKVQSLTQLGLLTVAVILINILANARFGDKAMYGRIDLTEEKRFTLTTGTKKLLREVDDVRPYPSWAQRIAAVPNAARARLRTACTATWGSCAQACTQRSPSLRRGSRASAGNALMARRPS